MRVYLAGPMHGLTVSKANSWRMDAEIAFIDSGIISYNPVSGHEPYTNSKQEFDADFASRGLSAEEIFRRDIFMIQNSDVILANIKDLHMPFSGTVWELGYAYGLEKLLVVVGYPEQFVSPFLTEAAIFYHDLNDAIYFIRSINK